MAIRAYKECIQKETSLVKSGILWGSYDADPVGTTA